MQPTWRKASFCASGECVEIAQRNDPIIVRDSKQTYGNMLYYPIEEWRGFIRDIKAGVFGVLGS